MEEWNVVNKEKEGRKRRENNKPKPPKIKEQQPKTLQKPYICALFFVN